MLTYFMTVVLPYFMTSNLVAENTSPMVLLVLLAALAPAASALSSLTTPPANFERLATSCPSSQP